MFFLSFCLVLFSSFLFTSCLVNKKGQKGIGFIYLFLIVFSQIILTFEVLSLLKAINSINFIISNIFIFGFSLFIWLKNERPIYRIQIKKTFKNMFLSLKKDKILFIFSLLFLVFLVLQLYLAFFSSYTFGDALSYYFPRCTTWIQQGALSHFETLDTRELIMPINKDLLYLWVMLLTKNINGVGIFSYFGFLLAITSLYNFSKELGFSIRTSLWSIFVFSSFALIGLEIHTPILDLFVGSLLLSSLYLLFLHCKQKTKYSLYFSSLAFAIALGTKTTALIISPAIFILFFVFLLTYSKEESKKTFFKWFLFLIFNFLVFSSYNYILNFIDFNNFISSKEQILLHSFDGGIKSFICSFIKYIFMFFDLSGMPDFVGYNNFINKLQVFALSLFGEKLDSYTSNYFLKYFVFNSKVTFISSLLGLFGIIAFVPSFFISIKKYFQNKKSKKRIVLFSFSSLLVLILLLFSGVLVYMGYNARFLLTFVVISSPILVYSYIRKNRYAKALVVFFSFIYLFCVPAEIILENITRNVSKNEEIQIYEFLRKKKPSKIATMIEQGNIPLYEIEKIKLNGVILDKLLPEKIEKYDLSQYEYIITNKYDVTSTIIVGTYNEAISSCTYWDREAKKLEKYDETKAVMVLCEIPHAYFNKNNFKEEEKILLKKYIILKNKRAENL